MHVRATTSFVPLSFPVATTYSVNAGGTMAAEHQLNPTYESEMEFDAQGKVRRVLAHYFDEA